MSKMLPKVFTKSTLVTICAVLLLSIVGKLGIGYLSDPWPEKETIYPDHPLVTVVEMPDKYGVGIIAKQNIPQGTLIFREKPLFLISTTNRWASTPLINRAVAGLNSSEIVSFKALSYHSDPYSIGWARNRARFHNNAFTITGERVGLFVYASRMNHACSSAINALYSYEEEEGELHFHAIKDIVQGEEVLTSYINTLQPRSERRGHLKKQYNFECKCTVCMLPTKESELSDNRLSKMMKILLTLPEWSTGVDGFEITKRINQIWNLSEQERWWGGRGALALKAASISLAHSDEPAGKAWALLAQKWLAIEFGKKHPPTLEAERIKEHPRSQTQWGSRERMRVEQPIPSN